MLLLNNSRNFISAGSFQAGENSGNITVNANLIAASANAKDGITANANSGQGGAVNIFGQLAGLDLLSRDELQARLDTTNAQKLDSSRSPANDITAISQTAPTLNGQGDCNHQSIPMMIISRVLAGFPTSCSRSLHPNRARLYSQKSGIWTLCGDGTRRFAP